MATTALKTRFLKVLAGFLNLLVALATLVAVVNLAGNLAGSWRDWETIATGVALFCAFLLIVATINYLVFAKFAPWASMRGHLASHSG